MTIVPTSTGAARATGLVLPDMLNEWGYSNRLVDLVALVGAS